MPGRGNTGGGKERQGLVLRSGLRSPKGAAERTASPKTKQTRKRAPTPEGALRPPPGLPAAPRPLGLAPPPPPPRSRARTPRGGASRTAQAATRPSTVSPGPAGPRRRTGATETETSEQAHR
ncbi:PREDICTED: basic salivary proline-rich protein 1-like [Chinchilla lanigera]|uniref:basic salivary proline-rich protein 1-like n=1 Tax=Chinchilla lanigera TaxID=34839 RepID=UPI000698C23D|nr:PREDICTED: basic salivary proline-rich protein 1-like [Chinchilla lanigera]